MTHDSFRRQTINDIKREINHWDNVGIRKYGVEVSVVTDFLNEVKNGTFDAVIDFNYWYYKAYLLPINFDTFFSWYLNRDYSIQTNGCVHQITPDNLVVFKCINDLLKNPLFSKDMKYLKLIQERVMLTDYSWRDVLRILKKVNELESIEDVLGIDFFFVPTENVNLPAVNQSREIFIFRDEMIQIMKDINYKNFGDIFKNPSSNCHEEYLRRMLISQLDVLRMIKARKKIYYFLPDYGDTYYEDRVRGAVSDINKDNTHYGQMARNMIFYVPEVSLDYDHFHEDEHERMASSGKETLTLAKGIFNSFKVPFKRLDLKAECERIQKGYGLADSKLFIGEEQINSIGLSNGEKLFSAYDFEVPILFRKWQGLYDLLYRQGNDAEFIGGCTYIMCDIIMSQIFASGNKRTAKALFNSMLCSRRIVPPIIDLLEDDHRLFQDIYADRSKHYENIIDEVLEDAIDTWEQLESGSFNKPLIINPSGIINRYVPKNFKQ